MTKNAIIIGAGIAGPAMAMQLKRMNIEPILFEAREESEMQDGVFLGITPNGINVLKKLININQLRAEYTPGKMVFCNSAGRQIGELDTRYQVEKYGAETIQIKRAHISKLLRDEAGRRGIKINYGYKLTEIKETGEGVEVYFENGQQCRVDFAIACDGVHSQTREQLFPNAPKPVYTKQLSTGAMVKLNGKTPASGHIRMVFGHRAFFAYAVSNRDEVWWFNNFYREEEPTRAEMLTTLPSEIKSRLLQIHRDDPAPIPEIIRQTDSLFVYPVYDIPVLPQWHTSRVCLIGDAAHATAPHIGQGASLALEDTVVLANCLRDQPTFEKAFQQFQKLRKPRVEKLIKTARKIGNTKSKPNPVAMFFRDLFLKHFIKLESKKLDWVYGYNPPDPF